MFLCLGVVFSFFFFLCHSLSVLHLCNLLLSFCPSLSLSFPLFLSLSLSHPFFLYPIPLPFFLIFVLFSLPISYSLSPTSLSPPPPPTLPSPPSPLLPSSPSHMLTTTTNRRANKNDMRQLTVKLKERYRTVFNYHINPRKGRFTTAFTCVM